MENEPQEHAEGDALPQLDARVDLGDQSVEHREEDSEAEVNEEGHPRQAFVAVEGVGGVRGLVGEAEQLQERLRRVGCVALGGARREGDLSAELHNRGDDSANEANKRGNLIITSGNISFCPHVNDYFT